MLYMLEKKYSKYVNPDDSLAAITVTKILWNYN